MLALGVWRLISPFVPAHTTQKIRVIGVEYVSTLQADVDMTELPEHFGGNAPLGLCGFDGTVPSRRRRGKAQ